MDRRATDAAAIAGIAQSYRSRRRSCLAALRSDRVTIDAILGMSAYGGLGGGGDGAPPGEVRCGPDGGFPVRTRPTP